MNKTSGTMSLHFQQKDSNQKPLFVKTSKPFFLSKFQRSHSQMQPRNFERKTLSKTLHSNLKQENKLLATSLRMNMSNHFTILESLISMGNLGKTTNFHVLGYEKFEKNPEKNLNSSAKKQNDEKKDVFEIAKMCSRENLNRAVSNKELKHFVKNLESPKIKEVKKHIIDLKKNIFYFQKENIVKTNQSNSNPKISEVYSKYFQTKIQNKICNLKDFSEFLKPKQKNQETTVIHKENDSENAGFLYKKKFSKLPRLKIESLKKLKT